jgi:hypothetical protein
MEESPKHTLSILNLTHSDSAHLIDFLSDLSSVLVVNLLRFIRAQVLAMCVRIASLPYSKCFHFDLCCKGEILQVAEIPRKRERV